MSDAPNPIQLQKNLAGVEYPATRDDLVSAAKNNGADDDMVSALAGMSKDSFDGPTAVSEAVSKG